MTMIKLALLICGKLTGKPYTINGDYFDIYHRFFQESQPHPDFVLDPYDVVREMIYPDEDKYDGIVLTGSASSAYENIEWINKLCDYITRVAEHKPHIKIIGICYGQQIIARALGGECVPNNGRWEIGPTPLNLTDLGKRLFQTDSLNIQQMHRDHVPTLPPNFHLLASTSISPIQGMVRFAPLPNAPSIYPSPSPDPSAPLPAIQIFAVQGHPEFTESIVTALVEQRSSSGVIDAEAAANAEIRRFWQNDGVPIVGKVIWKILQGTT